MPSFGVGAADQYLALICTVVVLFVQCPKNQGWLCPFPSIWHHVEFDLGVHYSIRLIQKLRFILCTRVGDWSARQGTQNVAYPPTPLTSMDRDRTGRTYHLEVPGQIS